MDLITHTDMHGLPAGGAVSITLPNTPDGLTEAIIKQLVAGSLKPHGVCRVAKRGGVEVLARYQCTCFGFDADIEQVVAKIKFQGRQNDEQKLLLAEDLITGELHDCLHVVDPAEDAGDDEEAAKKAAAEEAAKKAAAEEAAKKKAGNSKKPEAKADDEDQPPLG